MFPTNQHQNEFFTEKTQNINKDYVRTTKEQKLQLIDLVINQKYSMKLASQIVGIKLSTVKYIVKAYKNDKQCFMAKLKPKKIRIQKDKLKPFSQNQNLSLQESTSKIQEQTEPKINQQNWLKIGPEFIPTLTSFPFQNFYQFQGYFHFFPQLNNFSLIQNEMGPIYQGN